MGAKTVVRNRVLAALPPRTYQRLLAHLELVELSLGQILCEPFAEPTHVYFPNNAIVSLLAITPDGQPLEVGMVGYESLFGAPQALGTSVSPVRALVQATGSAMRMNARRFRSELKLCQPLQQKIQRAAFVEMSTAMQIAACNNAHRLQPRLARWLLTTSDCLASSSFFLTQNLLAQMIGVRRPGVSEAAAGLQERGVVKYRRGMLTILDRPRLLAASCGCYDLIRKLSTE